MWLSLIHIYAAAIVTKSNPTLMGLALGAIIGAAISAVVALIVAIPTLRLKGDYLSLIHIYSCIHDAVHDTSQHR